MPRVKGGPKTRQRRKKRLKLAKGQYGGKAGSFARRPNRSTRVRPMPMSGGKNRKRISPPLGRAHQCGGSGAWDNV